MNTTEHKNETLLSMIHNTSNDNHWSVFYILSPRKGCARWQHQSRRKLRAQHPLILPVLLDGSMGLWRQSRREWRPRRLLGGLPSM